MAMYPNATHGYMPFVKPAHKRQAAKKSKLDKGAMKAKSGDLKTYKVTLRDRNGFTYTYIIQADTTTKSMPVLCESRVAAPRTLSSSMPVMNSQSPSGSPESRRHAMLAQGKDDLTKVDDNADSAKKGLFNSLISFIKKKTSGSKSSTSKPQMTLKSKRKTKPPVWPKKRQRTISAMSNLDPIQESPEEDDDDFDSDSYTHDSASGSES